MRALANFLSAGVMVRLVNMQPYVIASLPPMPDGKTAEVTKYLNLSLEMSFAIAAVVCLVIGSLDVGRLLARQPARLNHAMR